MGGPRYLVSACLVGVRCRYNGKDVPDEECRALFESGLALPACPEELGGLPTPRAPTELREEGGRLRAVDREGIDRTEAFEEGARRCLALCRALGIREAILKSKSPSCGCGLVYDGSFSGRLVPGMGVAARLLAEHGVSVRPERGAPLP